MTMTKKILVVDDDIDQLDHVEMILKAEGYEVIKAQGQKEGEEAILSIIPDLAILDLMMENQDSGFVLCHQIKRLYPDMPVILLTAVKSATGVDFSPKSSGAASWIKADILLDKPVRPEQLRNEVKRLMV
jgi:DNA-binding response OmpR family regulator